MREYVQQRFDRLFFAFHNARERREECAAVLGKQKNKLERIHDLNEEIKRLKASLSEATSADQRSLALTLLLFVLLWRRSISMRFPIFVKN